MLDPGAGKVGAFAQRLLVERPVAVLARVVAALV